MVRASKLGWILGILGAVAAAGCSREVDEDSELLESKIDVSPTLAQPNQPTYATGVAMFGGYSPLFEQAYNGCVTSKVEGQPLAIKVGNVSTRFDYVLITSRTQLAKELGIDLDLKFKYGLGSVNPTFDLVDNFKEEGRSAFVLVRAIHTYKVERSGHPGDLAITPEAASAVSNPAEFLQKCGSHYVDGITYGGRVLLGLRFDVDSLDKVNDLKVGLGLGGGFGPVGIDGNFGVKVKNAMSATGATVSLSVQSQGYMIEKDGQGVDATSTAVKALLGGAFDEKTIDGLHGLVTKLKESVKADQCRDEPTGIDCAADGPGYLANTARQAAVLNVDLRPYALLHGAPPTATWYPLADALERTNDTLTAIAPKAAEIEEAYKREIKVFLEASGPSQNRFGLASKVLKAADRDQLLALATAWDERLRPNAGTDIKPLETLIKRCFNRAAIGGFEYCDPNMATGPEFIRADAAFKKYTAEGRVLPLVYVPIAPMSLSAATAKCDRPLKMRLPSRPEVEQMAVAVRRAGDLPTGGDLPRTVWHSGPASTRCPAFFNPPDAGDKVSLDRCAVDEQGHGKSPEDTKFPAFCVPSDGPFGGR